MNPDYHDSYPFKDWEKELLADVFFHLENEIAVKGLHFIVKNGTMSWEDNQDITRLAGNYVVFSKLNAPDKDQILEATLREMRKILLRYVDVGF